MNNAGESLGRQAPNPAWIELRSRLVIAQAACERWRKRLRNTLSRFPDPGLEESLNQEREQVAQAILQAPRRGAGTARLEVECWSEAGPQRRTVELDPARPPHEQALEWIAKVRKSRRGLALQDERRAAVEREHEVAAAWTGRLGSWLGEESAPPKPEIRRRESEVDGLARLLLPRGLWPQPPRTRGEEPATGPIRWDLPGGWILLAGRSGTENDLLTKRVALPHDLWFHAAHVAGSHVILRSPDGKPATPPDALVETAAGVAAWLSRLRGQKLAEVHCTEKRHVRKPRKAPVGTVALEHARTLRVRPVPPPRDRPAATA